MVTQSSEIGDGRPLSSGAFSPDGAALATAGFSGKLRLWDAATCKAALTVQAHDSHVTGGLPAQFS